MDLVAPRKQVMDAANLGGKYRLIAELGQGGMATVFLAVMMGGSGFRKLAVVKLLRPELAVDTDFVQMFLDEARLCARLSHPNIVHTYDVGVDTFGHLMAMEYLDGVSLHAAVAKLRKNGTPLRFPLHAKVLLDVLEGLRYAHELVDYDGQSLAIVHRDVSPQNIFVTYDGQVKLLDFGIAKAATSSVQTATGVIKGKLTYMAPEQARGDEVDARTDLYAVGVMLWEAVTGRRRWPAGLSQPALFTRMALGEPPESPDAASHGYPAVLDEIVMKALASQPDDRYQTAAEFYNALEPVLRSMEPVSLRDLAGTLSVAFADSRQRMRNLIEEQFRLIDSGRPPSVPHQLPTVASPNIITASQTFEAPLLDATPGPQTSMMAETVRPQATRPTRRESFRSRSRIGMVAAGIVALAALVIIAMNSYKPDAAADPPPTLPAAIEARGPIEPITSALPIHLTQDPPTRDDPPAPSARRSDPHNHAAPASPAHTAAAHPVVAPDATAAPAPPSADPTSGPVPLHTPQGKPKVQLERDNPWP